MWQKLEHSLRAKFTGLDSLVPSKEYGHINRLSALKSPSQEPYFRTVA